MNKKPESPEDRQWYYWVNNVTRISVYLLCVLLALFFSIHLYHFMYTVIGPYIPMIISWLMTIVGVILLFIDPFAGLFILEMQLFVDLLIDAIHIEIPLAIFVAVWGFYQLTKLLWKATKPLAHFSYWYKSKFPYFLASILVVSFMVLTFVLPVDLSEWQEIALVSILIFAIFFGLYTKYWRCALTFFAIVTLIPLMVQPITQQLLVDESNNVYFVDYTPQKVYQTPYSASYMLTSLSYSAYSGYMLDTRWGAKAPTPKGRSTRVSKAKKKLSNFHKKLMKTFSWQRLSNTAKVVSTSSLKFVTKPFAKPVAKYTKPMREKFAELKARADAKAKAKAEAKARKKAEDVRKKLVESIKFDSKQLQKKYKHAAKTFGIKGNYNKANQAKLESRIKQHMQDLETQVIKGQYQKSPATHFFNKRTGVNVVTEGGRFTTVFKPSTTVKGGKTESQLKAFLRSGNLGGS